ncbi:ankyrin repeat domain-containing protein [Candidatus Uabimicrobium amorphum]|uniref:Uncharacterized protein n=1 Tax=Uabimicrobium amorphum TaxID=2596890 RepID=A0A5S9F3I0_UABAM|nr:ankyrin repeat domain-containing protein [Candidatus Uabimicrobium amorphum]BBM84518.1 hypothetical protein UABAM_02879 [Candidatus Uabimicrobium amorphum]
MYHLRIICLFTILPLALHANFDLQEAVSQGKVEAIKKYLSSLSAEERAELLDPEYDETEQLFHTAIENNHLQIVKLLCADDAETFSDYYLDFSRKHSKEIFAYFMENSNYNYTPLMIAAYMGQVEQVKKLVKETEDINAATEAYYETALMFAANAEISKILIEAGADSQLENIEEETAIHYAIKHNNVEQFKLLINYLDPENKDDVILDITTKQMLKIALDSGARLLPPDKMGFLCYAVDDQNKQLANLLLECGADINKPDAEAYLPLMYAESKEWAEYLVSKGADVNAKSENGTIMQNVSRNDQLIAFLVEQGADQWTHFMYLACFGHNEKIQTHLAKNNTDLHKRNIHGETPLLIAASNDQVKTVEILLEAGADVNAVDNEQWASIMYAAKQPNKGMMQILIDNGADLTLRDNEDDSAMSFVQNEIENAEHDLKEMLRYKENYTEEDFAETNKILADGRAIRNMLRKAGVDGWNKVMYASLMGDHNTLEELLSDESLDFHDVHATNDDGQTALMFAKDKRVVDILVKEGAELESETAKEETALTFAVKAGNKEVFDALIEAGADIHLHNSKWESLVEIAIQKEQTEMVDYLVKHKARGWTPLMAAAYKGDLQMCKSLLANGANLNAKNNDGETAFLVSLKHKYNSELFTFFIEEKKVDINQSDKYMYTALMHAAYYLDAVAIVDVLLADGIDHTLKNNYEETAFDIALDNADAYGVQAFFDNDKAPGWTPLLAAVYRKDYEEVLVAIDDENVDFQARDKKTRTALLLCVGEKWDEDVFELLLDKGANIEDKDIFGRGVLHHAVAAKNIAVLKRLLASGVDLDAQDSEGNTALMMAIRDNNHAIVATLKEADPDILLENKNGESARSLAKMSGDEKMIELVEDK